MLMLVPYRLDLRGVSHDVFDRLVDLGAIDIETSHEGQLSALMPDRVTPEQVASVIGMCDMTSSPATGRDADSVWVLTPRPIRIGRLHIVPAHLKAGPDALRLIDSSAFGTGLHPTTALCLEALDEAVQVIAPDQVLDVGTGSGVLAIAALKLGVPHAVATDIDAQALGQAADNARINEVSERLHLVHGGPEALSGSWPLVLANVLAASLIEMAPSLVRRVGHRGRLVLSGIPKSVEPDVDRAYGRLGMRRVDLKSRAGWIALVMHASW